MSPLFLMKFSAKCMLAAYLWIVCDCYNYESNTKKQRCNLQICSKKGRKKT